MKSETFQAGPLGDSIRSDCQIFYTPGPQSLDLKIRSKVQALFSRQLIELAERTLDTLGIHTGLVQINDFGALPFVMMAQIETAVKRAHPELSIEALPEFKNYSRYESSFGRFRRSRLYLPGNQPKLFLNAGIHSPDCIILDLEDSVPVTEKDTARYIVRNALRSINFLGSERLVRINRGTLGLLDLEAILPHNVHTIILPKCETADQVIAVDTKIQDILKQNGIKQHIYLIPILESALGVLNAKDIAMASKNIVGLSIGLEDYTADIGVQRTTEGVESLFARSMLINAAKAVEIQALDSVFSDVNDEKALRTSLQTSKSLGFDGMGCIHPRQIKAVHEEYAPTDLEIEKAKTIISAAVEAETKGLGVIAVGSKMIDPPVVRRAESTLSLAIKTGILSENWENE